MLFCSESPSLAEMQSAKEHLVHQEKKRIRTRARLFFHSLPFAASQPVSQPDHPGSHEKRALSCAGGAPKVSNCAAFPPHTDVLLRALCPPAPALHFLPQPFSPPSSFFLPSFLSPTHICHPHPPLLSFLPPLHLPPVLTSSSLPLKTGVFTLDSYPAMDIISPHFPLSLVAGLALYPLLFGILRQQAWVKEILPLKADIQKHYHLANKMVASTHSTIMTLVGSYLLLSVDWTQNDISTYQSLITRFLVGLELGYLTQDTVFEFYQRMMFGVGSNLILFHHVAVILGSAYYLNALTLTNPGPYFIGMLSLMNLSTPILHFRWALQSRGQTFMNSGLKRAVDTSLLVTYFWCRVFGNWWMGYSIGASLGVSWYEAPLYIGKKYTITTTTMFFMNVAWWLILAKQWIKSVQVFYFGKQRTGADKHQSDKTDKTDKADNADKAATAVGNGRRKKEE